jgi:hypothetical protein
LQAWATLGGAGEILKSLLLIGFRKRVEEIFGWMKTAGGFRKTGSKGTERTQLAAW